MAIRDGSLTAVGCDHRYVRRFGEFDERLFGVGDGDSAAGVDQGKSGVCDDLRDLFELLRTRNSP